MTSFLKAKHQNGALKCNQTKKYVDSIDWFISGRFASNFYIQMNKIDKINDISNYFLKKFIVPVLPNIDNVSGIFPKTILFFKEYQSSYFEDIDWTRGRFTGAVVQIVVKGGQINEKVFITLKGKTIVVKRNELGLIARLSKKR